MALLVVALLHLFHTGQATYGSHFSYTTTNHLAPGPLYALYKSPAFSNGYQYSYFPSVIPPSSLYNHQIWPVVNTYNTPAVSLYQSPFTAPCQHGHYPLTSSFSTVFNRPIIGPPVKTKANNSTEHVFKPIYKPFAWGTPPLFAYQGSIQHIPMPPKDETEKMDKPETKTETKADAKETTASETEKEEAPMKTEEPAKEEAEEPKEEAAAEMTESKDEKEAIVKAKRDSVSIAKRFGLRKKSKKMDP